jgi:hypothetical protein
MLSEKPSKNYTFVEFLKNDFCRAIKKEASC